MSKFRFRFRAALKFGFIYTLRTVIVRARDDRWCYRQFANKKHNTKRFVKNYRLTINRHTHTLTEYVTNCREIRGIALIFARKI